MDGSLPKSSSNSRILCVVMAVFLLLSALSICIIVYLNMEILTGTNAKKDSIECLPEHPAINDFPEDYFTQEERKRGYVLVHVAISIVIFFQLGAVCEFYFIPSLKFIANELRIPGDIAGATFMAIGSSAPTLFISIISVFFTQDAADIGLGTIVGSTIFNTLFIISASGLAVASPVVIKQYPIFRDSVAYLISTIALIVTVGDHQVTYVDSLAFMLIYGAYILAIVYNDRLTIIYEKWFRPAANTEEVSTTDSETINLSSTTVSETDENNKHSSCYDRTLLLVGYPVVVVYSVLLPDCLFRKGYLHNVLQFTVSMFLLGILSYILVWMVCIIGYTYRIPDCVMGMTFLAAGSSLPDVMASVIVARENKADMSISNAVGSNVFDMLCLGLPWFIKTAFIKPNSVIALDSQTTMLSGSLLIGTMLYVILSFYLNKWRLDKKIGVLFMFTYFAVIGLATVVELLACPCNLHL